MQLLMEMRHFFSEWGLHVLLWLPYLHSSHLTLFSLNAREHSAVAIRALVLMILHQHTTWFHTELHELHYDPEFTLIKAHDVKDIKPSTPTDQSESMIIHHQPTNLCSNSYEYCSRVNVTMK